MNASTLTPDTDVGLDWSIHQRVAHAQLVIGNIPTDMHVSIRTEKANYDFDYLSKSLLLCRAREVLAPLGVAVLISEEAIRQEGSNRTVVTMRVTLSCWVDGNEQSVSIVRSAYGNDPFDKGPQKAGTTAVRLALGDLLMQGGGDVDERDAVEFQAAPSQALGVRPATVEQLKFATDLVMRAQLDKAMPNAAHAILRLARPIAQRDIGAGLEPEEAIRLIDVNVASKLIERLEVYAQNPKGAKLVWDKVAEWEGENGYPNSVAAADTAPTDTPPPVTDADGNPIPF